MTRSTRQEPFVPELATPPPTPADIEYFDTHGYLAIPGLVPAEELAWLAEVYDRVAQRVLGVPVSEAGRRGAVPEDLLTVVSPEGYAPELKASAFHGAARRTLARLFGVAEDELACGWRLFLKPAGGEGTPWHQDAAYRPPPHRGGTVWLPLDPATLASGRLEYVAGSHRGPLVGHDHLGHHLVAQEIPAEPIEGRDLAPGDALVHHCRTLHRAGANVTDRPRRAFAVVGQVVTT